MARPTQHDWVKWRKAYVTSTKTYAEISTLTGAPSASALEQRGARESWKELRQEFQKQLSDKTIELQAEMQSEVRLRQAKLGRALQQLAVKGLATLKPEELGELGVSRLARIGAELERKALGMEEVQLRIHTAHDLRRLTDAELLELAKGAAITTDSE